MTKPTIQWYWRIDRKHLYAKLNALGGMYNTKIKPSFAWQGKLNLLVGSPEPWSPELFEVRVNRSSEFELGYRYKAKHRISVRCLKCHAWIPFGRLHQHVGSQRCKATAEIASALPPIPSLRSARP